MRVRSPSSGESLSEDLGGDIVEDVGKGIEVNRLSSTQLSMTIGRRLFWEM